MSHVESLFAEHLEISLGRITQTLEELGISELIVGAGREQIRWEDDQPLPFYTDRHFAWLCPQTGPGHLLKLVPGNKPKLLRVAPKTFWVEQTAAPASWWADQFEIVTVESVQEAWNQVAPAPRASYLGHDTRHAELAGLIINRELVLNAFSFWRERKTPYEIECIVNANESGAKGHEAVRDAFLSGASEFESLIAFLGAVGQGENELSFSPIFASNEKAAILHYEHRRHIRNQGVMLVDAGTVYNGYASDISRTWVAPHAHPLMKTLQETLNATQQQICQWVVSGKSQAQLQFEALVAVARILEDAELLRLNGDYEMAVREGIVQAFTAHGLGHGLGICVHENVGYFTNRYGVVAKPFEKMPKWRLAAPMEVGSVLTVEPGIYFNAMLLEKARADKHADRYNFPLAESLVPWGGIRIEDDVLVTAAGPRNITREFLPT